MPPSRSPSRDAAPQQELQGSRSLSRRRGRSRNSRPVSRSWSQGPSEASVDEDSPPERPQSRNARRRKNKKRQQGGGLPAVDEAEDTTRQVAQTVQGAKDTAGGAVQGGVQENKGGGSRDEPLRLRLDLNIDAEVTLKARVHGDLTLGLLG